MSNGIGRVWAVNAEGGDEGRPNGVGPVWIENADQLGSKLPEPASGDTGKVLGVLNSDGDIGWVPDQEGMAQVQADWDQGDPSEVSYIAHKPTIPTVDQAYSASSTNAQSGVAVASAISGKQDTISDLETIRSGAALGATSLQPGDLPTVDQAYNASSTNAQSGTAVAQAIAAIPSASYSPGNGIAISMSNEISVDHDDTLSSAYRYETRNVTSVSETYKAGIAIMSGSLLDEVINDSEDADATLKIHIPGNTFFSDLNNLVAAKVIIADTDEFDHNAYAPDATLSVTYDSQNYRYVIDEQDVEIKAFYQEWEPISGGLQDRATYLGFGFYTDGGPQVITPSYAAQVSSTTLTDPVVIDVPIPMANKLLSVANPVPSSAVGDAGKVLTVDAEGAPAWETPATVTVDQTYNSASTNAQSGVAVAQAIASVPSEVSSASGHFDIGGAVPVKVNYTGSSITNSVRPTDATSSQVKFDIPGALDSLTVTVSENTYTNGTTAEYWYTDAQNNKIQPADGTYSAPSGMFDSQNQRINKGTYTLTPPTSQGGTPAHLVMAFDFSMTLATYWTIQYPVGIETTIPNIAAPGSGDAGKVLTVDSNGDPEWVAPPTAGNGIDIVSGEISVRAGSGLDFVANVTTGSMESPGAELMGGYQYNFLGHLNADTVALLKSGPVTLTPKYRFTLDGMYYGPGQQSSGARFAICEMNSTSKSPSYTGTKLIADTAISRTDISSFTLSANTPYTVDLTTLSSISVGSWANVEANPTNFYLALICVKMTDLEYMSWASMSRSGTDPLVVADYVAGDPTPYLVATNQVPASAVGDAGKVLTVDAQGDPAWGMLGSVKSIQQVNALPATPDANTLYLIPEA